MRTYFLERNDRKSVWEICERIRQMHQSIDGYQAKFLVYFLNEFQELQCEACPDQTPGEDGETKQQKELAIIPDELNSISGDNHEHDATTINAVETKTMKDVFRCKNSLLSNFQEKIEEHVQNGTIANLPAKHDIVVDERKNGPGLDKKGNRQNRSKACLIV